MDKNKIIELLENIDLKNWEAKLYLILLENPSHNLSNIAKQLNLTRSTLYTGLENLIQLGLVEKRNKKYNATGPDKVQILLQNKQKILSNNISEFQEILPHLNSVFYFNTVNEDYKLIKDKENFQIEINNIIKTKPDSVYLFGAGSVIIDILGLDNYQNFDLKRIKQKIPIRELVYTNYYYRQMNSGSDYFRNFKWIPDKFRSMGAYIVYNENTLLITSNQPQALKITNYQISQLFKSNFELLWESL